MARFTFLRPALCTLGLWLCVLLCGGCQPIQADTTKSPKVPADTEPQVIISTSEGRYVTWKVELALTDAQRIRGLMHRDSLAADRGMLFVFPYESIQSFWMKNTRIPLDMIFIRQNMTVAGVVSNARPHDTSSYHVSTPSRFVLEVNGGQAETHKIKPGDAVRFVGVPGL